MHDVPPRWDKECVGDIDFESGMTVRHWPGRTISEAGNTWLTLMKMNQHPLQFDRHHADYAEYGQVLVNSGIILCLVGDTLYARSRILGKRLSARQRIVTVEMTGPESPGETVIIFERSFLVRCCETRCPDGGLVESSASAARTCARCRPACASRRMPGV